MISKNKVKTTIAFAASRIPSEHGQTIRKPTLTYCSVIATSILFVWTRLSVGIERNSTVAIALPVMIQQGELALALISAMMIPCVSLFGVVETTSAMPAYGSGTIKSGGEIKVTMSVTQHSVRPRHRDEEFSDTIGLVSVSSTVQSGEEAMDKLVSEGASGVSTLSRL